LHAGKLRLVALQLPFRFGELDLIRLRIDGEQHLTLLHQIPLLEVHGHDLPVNARLHRD
jgi:hypothetical protein